MHVKIKYWSRLRDSHDTAEISWDGSGWVVSYTGKDDSRMLVGVRPGISMLGEEEDSESLAEALIATLRWEGALGSAEHAFSMYFE